MKQIAKIPFVVPPFKAPDKAKTKTFFWWGWHPCYPYWSKSCWGGFTEQEAREALDKSSGALDYYAIKLINEIGGQFIEIDSRDVARPAIWERIEKNFLEGKYGDVEIV
jgi:hypothetical protein